MSPYSPYQSLAPFMGNFTKMLASKGTLQLSIKFADSFEICSIVVGFFQEFKPADIEGVSLRVTSAASIDFLFRTRPSAL